VGQGTCGGAGVEQDVLLGHDHGRSSLSDGVLLLETPRRCACPRRKDQCLGRVQLRCLGKFPNDPDVAEEFNAALVTIREATQDAGVIAAIHTASGEVGLPSGLLRASRSSRWHRT
jgi:hypothetical protein